MYNDVRHVDAVRVTFAVQRVDSREDELEDGKSAVLSADGLEAMVTRKADTGIR